MRSPATWTHLRDSEAIFYALRGGICLAPDRRICCRKARHLATSALARRRAVWWDQSPLVMADRERVGSGSLTEQPSCSTARSAKTTESGGPRGYDAGKKVKGRKRQVMVDTDGRGLILEPQPADVQDRDGAVAVLRLSRRAFPSWPKRLRMLATPATNRPRRRSSPSRSCASRLTRSALPSTRGGGWSKGSSRGSAETGASGRILRQRSPRPEPSSTPLPS